MCVCQCINLCVHVCMYQADLGYDGEAHSQDLQSVLTNYVEVETGIEVHYMIDSV